MSPCAITELAIGILKLVIVIRWIGRHAPGFGSVLESGSLLLAYQRLWLIKTSTAAVQTEGVFKLGPL